MRILHSADWHLGRRLYGRSRHDEFDAFLDWLAETIEREQVDVLLVAGDVFDSSAPPNHAQSQYYRFLHRVSGGCCRHVVVIGGNHDSPSFLEAPRELLAALSVHVVGKACDDPADEVLLLRDRSGAPALIVCAVPYLRDRDIRTVEAGESVTDKAQKLVDGIVRHYKAVADVALRRRREADRPLPIVGMGHLFAAGGETVEGDGVRELYVGSLAHVSGAVFPASFDYLALGHLHKPQRVGGDETKRYSGSPLPMGFGEAGQRKAVCLIEFGTGEPVVRELEVPVFRRLASIEGDWPALAAAIETLVATGERVWVEVTYDGAELLSDLRERLAEAVADSAVEILRIRNNRVVQRVLGRLREEETLDDLDPHDVFRRCLDAHEVPAPQRALLEGAYREVVTALLEGEQP